jgi:prepilin-type N-terminal cleavage/methylation domain-containing protein
MTTFPTSRRPPSRAAGYSLIEVLVACAIAGVLMGAAIPRMPATLGTFALQNTTFEIANHLRLARERAVATNGKGRIVFGSTSYQLRRENPVGSGTYVTDGAVYELPSNTSVTSSPVDPTFDSRGLVTAPYTITVANGFSTKTITVTAIGRVVVD